MSPVAPMPYASPVETYGLKSWFRLVSGELSITRAGSAPVPDDDDDDEPEPDELDEQAAAPAASSPAAATAANRLWFGNLLILCFLSGLLRIRSWVISPFGLVQVPAGGGPGSGQLHESRVLPAAPVVGQRTPRTERAAGRRGLLGLPGPPRPPEPQVLRVRGGGDQQPGVGVPPLLGDLLGRA